MVQPARDDALAQGLCIGFHVGQFGHTSPLSGSGVGHQRGSIWLEPSWRSYDTAMSQKRANPAFPAN
jgi:hypothetical protein